MTEHWLELTANVQRGVYKTPGEHETKLA